MNIEKLFEVAGRTAVVTGGSGGIGAMIAEGLVRAGARVWICARKESELKAKCEELRQWGECESLAVDLSVQEGIDALVEAVSGSIPQLDILVNNAGRAWSAPIDTFPRSAFEKVLNLNVTAPFLLTQKFLPLLRQAATRDEPARIINIASIDGLNPPDLDTFAYSASKSAMIMLTRHMAKVLAPQSITVNAIAPGIFASKMTAFWFNEDHPSHVPMPAIPLADRPGDAEDISGAVLYLSSRAGRHVTGITLPVSGGQGVID